MASMRGRRCAKEVFGPWIRKESVCGAVIVRWKRVLDRKRQVVKISLGFV
jgi:hypothetical protein